MIIFDGQAAATKKEAEIQQKVAVLQQAGTQLTIVAILFSEDAGSRLYTRLKQEAAGRVGIKYVVYEHSLREPVEQVGVDIEVANTNPDVHGIIIQKPTRRVWELQNGHADPEAFNIWWRSITTQIAENKDVDGLHPTTMEKIKDGSWQAAGRVLPATCQAVWTILEQAPVALQQAKVVIIGKSDLLGLPLYYDLKNKGIAVELLRKLDLQARMTSGLKLTDATVIVSATGVENLVQGEMIENGVVLIDVGEPRPDVNRESVSKKAAFLTPVPGGVGPMTVVCLLENVITLYTNQSNTLS